MISVKLTVDFDEMAKKMTDIQKSQIPFAAMLTVNDLAKNIAMSVVRDSMSESFDKGATRWSKAASLYTTTKSKSNLRAQVYLKGNRGYLPKLMEGGVVTPLEGMKSLIQPITKNYKINKFGNVPRNTLKKLSANKKKYFYGRPGNKKSNTFGLYQRPKNKGDKFKLLIKVETSARGQRAFWSPEKDAEAYVKRRFTMTFNKFFKKAMSTAR
tara:strand:- start:127 stop:762 length:636 start_codon:yes stop_codon:yes gene_type:complete